jgi:hypothetical protein
MEGVIAKRLNSRCLGGRKRSGARAVMNVGVGIGAALTGCARLKDPSLALEVRIVQHELAHQDTVR